METQKQRKNKVGMLKTIGGVAGIIIMITISLITPPDPLIPESMRALGILAGCVIWMLFGTFEDYVCMMMMCSLWVITKAVPFATAFSEFAGTTIWLLIGALTIGVAASETGLLSRIAYYFMKIFPASFKGQSLALIASGIVIGPLIPSTAVKSAIVAPIAKNISDNLGYEARSKGSAGIFAAFYNGFIISAPIFLSASFISYAIVGILPAEKSVDWIQWFIYAVVWGIVHVTLMALIGFKLYDPKDGKILSKDFVNQKLKEMGALSRNEKIALLVFIACLLLWMTERIHGIASALVAVVAACVLITAKLVSRQQFRAKLAWDTVIFIGCFLAISTVFSSLKINEYIQLMLGEILAPLLSNIWIFVPVLCIIMYLIRFVIVSWTASIIIMGTLLIPIAMSVNMHPFIIIFVCYTCTNTWNVVYQNTPYIAAMVATDDHLATYPQMLPYSIGYMISNIIANMASIPVWIMLGLV